MIDLKIFLRALFCKKSLHARVNLMSNNNKKIPSLRVFTVYINYCIRKYTIMVLQYKFLTLKLVLINETEWNKRLPKIFAGEIFQKKKKKSFTHWFKKTSRARPLKKIILLRTFHILHLFTVVPLDYTIHL